MLYFQIKYTVKFHALKWGDTKLRQGKLSKHFGRYVILRTVVTKIGHHRQLHAELLTCDGEAGSQLDLNKYFNIRGTVPT